MTHIAMSELTTRQKYNLITGSVGPRPIALVTSLDANGLCNAAPYSAFNYMGEDPPLFAIAMDLYGDESHRPGERKDTLNNIVERHDFVVNMVDESILERTVLCASDFPYHVSEVEAVGFSLAPSTIIRVPRIAEAPIAWECNLFKLFELDVQRIIVFGEIVGMYFKDDLVDEQKMRVNVERFEPCGRLGGPNYCKTTDRVRLPVPTFLPSAGVPRE